MRAAQIQEYGDASAIKINDIDKPAIQADQVLVEVFASSLNPFDSAVRSGYMKDAIPLELPVTLGGDISGNIVELGQAVNGFAVGDRVYGQSAVVAGNSGAFAEFTAVKSSQIAKAPDGMDFSQAASLPLVGVSAQQGLTEHINLQAGQKIFIHGGSGGIGTIAIQLAKSIGAYVATTASGDQIERVKSLGADEVIDYKTQDFASLLKDYDAVFDTVGGDDFNASLAILKKGGIAVSMIAPPDETKANQLGVIALTQHTHVTTEALNQLRESVEAGKFSPQVVKVYGLDDIQQAFIDRESGAVNGKIVIALKA